MTFVSRRLTSYLIPERIGCARASAACNSGEVRGRSRGCFASVLTRESRQRFFELKSKLRFGETNEHLYDDHWHQIEITFGRRLQPTDFVFKTSTRVMFGYHAELSLERDESCASRRATRFGELA